VQLTKLMMMLVLVGMGACAKDPEELIARARIEKLKDQAKRQERYRKLLLEEQLARARRQAYAESWAADCHRAGEVLNLSSDADLSCIAAPAGNAASTRQPARPEPNPSSPAEPPALPRADPAKPPK
jgi:hypothetical protein